MHCRCGRRLWTRKQGFLREARRRCTAKLHAKTPPGTPLDRKTAVKKNARWRIPEKTHKIHLKINDFRRKASENRSETLVRQNRVCTHICGARTREDPPAEHFRRKNPSVFTDFIFEGFAQTPEIPTIRAARGRKSPVKRGVSASLRRERTVKRLRWRTSGRLLTRKTARI